MNLQQALTQCRTLVVDGPEDASRSGLMSELARHGFTIRHAREALHHLDPTLPYRELLAMPGRLAVDGSIIHELVYGPLRRGHSRVTWIQALDFAEAVAERDGALIHLTSSAPARPAPCPAAQQPDGADAVSAYARAFRTLAQHVPVVTVDAGELGHPIRAPAGCPAQLRRMRRKLTVG
ncbi:hypothetical protein [Streptomyces sp. NPDC058371]|uniref:hypothetical protein n=1 Tax=Streptomyces sp. NPDC058371 TaxID=3346463 RepID=UPI0036575B0B